MTWGEWASGDIWSGMVTPSPILMQEVSKYEVEENLVVWDSHINFNNDWISTCLESKPEDFTAEEKREWRCADWYHPGPLLSPSCHRSSGRHVAQLYMWPMTQIEWLSIYIKSKPFFCLCQGAVYYQRKKFENESASISSSSCQPPRPPSATPSWAATSCSWWGGPASRH